MNICHTVSEMRRLRHAQPAESWGLVPTMGYLHEGHLSLVERARADNDRVAVTIFVNPTQFAPTEDLSTYPRSLTEDLAMLQAAGVDLVFVPGNEEMYPPDFQTAVLVQEVAKPLEGRSRPTHFQGVATVVAKLFNIVQPTRAYFGQKDAQQTVVLRQMVRDLNFNLELIVCPTVREADGLAKSSRNAYLTPEQRQAATVLYRALQAAQTAVQQGDAAADAVRGIMRRLIEAEPAARIDYVSVADALSLAELTDLSGVQTVLISTAVFFGKTRLIDNVLVDRAANVDSRTA